MTASRRPDFLGIGTVRGGSTWMHDLLDKHPDVWLPTEKRKELVYFDRLHRTRSARWYFEQFANAPDDAAAVGEISPTYLSSPGAAERIRATLPDLDRLLVILRDPARRAWSEYQWRRRHDNLSDPIEAWLEQHEEFDAGSRYGDTVPRFLQLYAREELLVLISEEAFADPVGTRERMAAHLGVDAARFPADAGTKQVNEGGMPRFGRAYSVASRLRRQFVWRDLDAVPTLAKRLGLRRLLIGSGAPLPKPAPEELTWLHERYATDRDWVESHLGRRIDAWGPSVDRE